MPSAARAPNAGASLQTSGMMRSCSNFQVDDRSDSRSKLPTNNIPPVARLFLSNPQHVPGGQLRGLVQATGGRTAGVVAGLVALWHWRPGDAALARQTNDRSTDDLAHKKAAISGVFFRQFSVHPVHAVWREPDQRGLGGHHHGHHSGHGGTAELGLFTRADWGAGVDGHWLRRLWYCPFCTVKI